MKVATIWRREKLTKVSVDRAWRAREKGVKTIIKDTVHPGLSLVVNEASAVYRYEYKPRGKDDATGKRWPTRHWLLGNVQQMALDKARTKAGEAKTEVRKGGDPAKAERDETERRSSVRTKQALLPAGHQVIEGEWSVVPEAEPTLEGWIEPYREFIRKIKKAEYVKEEVRNVRTALANAKATTLLPREFRKRHVMDLLGATTGTALPRKALGSLSRFLGYLIARDIIETNPISGIDKHWKPKPPNARGRYLTMSEVGAVYRAAGDLRPERNRDDGRANWTRIVRFALLIPARRGEIGAMRHCDVDLEAAVWSQPGKMTKNGQPHAFPLPPVALALLREQMAAYPNAGPDDPVWPGGSAGGFKGWGSLQRRINPASGTTNWSWHDIRRTVNTQLGERGEDFTMLDAMLNHRRSASLPGISWVYQRAEYLQPRHDALQHWERLVLEAAEERASERKISLAAGSE